MLLEFQPELMLVAPRSTLGIVSFFLGIWISHGNHNKDPLLQVVWAKAPLQFIEFAAWSRVLLDDVPIVMFCLQRVRPCHEQNVAMLEKLPKCMNMTVNRLVVRILVAVGLGFNRV